MLHGRPDWADAAARGDQLLDYLDAVEADHTHPCPRQFQFPAKGEIAFAGESTREALWGASNDLLHPSAFLRIYTPDGSQRSAMHCVRFLARVQGRLMGFYAERRVIVIEVDHVNFEIVETF